MIHDDVCYVMCFDFVFNAVFSDDLFLHICFYFQPFYRQTTLLSSKTLVDKIKIELQELVLSARKHEKPYKLQVEKLQNSFKDAVQVFSGLQKVRPSEYVLYARSWIV